MSSSVAKNGATEPEPKRRRLLDAGGPIEDDETARRKMRDARVFKRGVNSTYPFEYDGFDPDNVRGVKSDSPYDEGAREGNESTPMGYFAQEGDLPMMRWLYVNGADTRDVAAAANFPMWLAALHGKMEVCKWLISHGAAKDVKRRTRNRHDSSPLSATFVTSFRRDLSRWLILNGALCKDDNSGEFDFEIMKRDLVPKLFPRRRGRERMTLLEWANDLHQPRTSFLLFLSGALSAPQHAYHTRRASPLKILSGKSGVMELIGDYVGFVRGREARIIRQLTEMLPNLIQQFGDNSPLAVYY